MLKKILKFIGIILLLLIVLGLFNYEKLNRLRNTITLFEKENIVYNFLNMEQIIPTRLLEKSPNPTKLPVNISHQLPVSFESKGQTKNVQEFIDRTLTTGLLIIHKDTIVFEKYYN